MTTDNFVHEINVTWGDCDPAQIAYTARLPYFALDAINAWWEAHFDGDGWFQLQIDRNIGTPFVNLSMDFRSQVTPRHKLMCETYPTRLGNKSITFGMKARQNGVLCFEGSFTCVFTIADVFKSQSAPEELARVIKPLVRADLA